MEFNGKWQPDSDDFRKTCLRLCDDFTSFKRDPIFIRYIGNDIRKQSVAKSFYDYIVENYPSLLKVDFSENDMIGSPMLYKFDKYEYSPGTLRFMKVIGDINKKFRGINKVVEIGSGYGGQAFCFHSFDDINYTCIDIPECLKLCRLYHRVLGWEKCNYMDVDNIKKGYYDICISDYCLSEMDKDGIDFYIQNVVDKCKFAYITSNSQGEMFEYLTTSLMKKFSIVDVEFEEPKTTHHINRIIYCQ